MSVFPTKILLATDGSKEAASASQTAAELAQKTGSELHVVHVGQTLGPRVTPVMSATGKEPCRVHRRSLKGRPRRCWKLRWSGLRLLKAPGCNLI
jgi:nucleotide-binding universal stress UspA family protein